MVKTAKTCNNCDEVSETELNQCRESIGEHDFLNLQRRVVIMHI